MSNRSKVLKGFTQQFYDALGKLVLLFYVHKKRLQPKTLNYSQRMISSKFE